MFGLATLVDELASEYEHPEVVTAVLSRTIEYWERARLGQPTLGEFEPAKEYITTFRQRLKKLESRSEPGQRRK
jgi:hypothetical protein